MARKTYPREYREHLVALVQQGRTPESLAREFEPTAVTIRNWVKAAAAAAARELPVDKDRRIRDLERQVALLQEEREILRKAAARFARESGSNPRRGTDS